MVECRDLQPTLREHFFRTLYVFLDASAKDLQPISTAASNTWPAHSMNKPNDLNQHLHASGHSTLLSVAQEHAGQPMNGRVPSLLS